MLNETDSFRPSVCLIVPTINPMPLWRECLDALTEQALRPDRIVMVDSSSEDGAREIAEAHGLVVDVIRRESFNHGGTRRAAVEKFCQDMDVVVFMTQDSIVAEPDSLRKLVRPFADPGVGAVYGRQLPRSGAGPIEAHGRFFNYPAESKRKSVDEIAADGIKAAFFSNAWGAYRVSSLNAVGGIPGDAICSEDSYVAARMLAAGYDICYASDALAEHSHDFSFAEEFRRYFDIGVFHAREPWLQERFGDTGDEGWRFVRSEFVYLLKKAPWRIPEAGLRNLLKIMAYKLGRCHSSLPTRMVRSMSSHGAFWLQTR